MNTSRHRILTALAVAWLTLPAIVFAQQASSEEVESLKRAVMLQEKSIRDLKSRINQLEGQHNAPLPAAAAPAPSPAPGQPRSYAEEAEAEMARSYGRQSPIDNRAQFDDKQEAAPRPSDFTLDPKFRGFIPVPHTVFMIKFNPKPHLDMMFDTKNSGNDFRFVPATIPVGSAEGGGERFNANGNGSQLRLDMRAPGIGGNFRFYYQNDFFGSDTKNFQYRLQHLYGEYYGFVAGYTYGVFEDPDAWPDTVDYEGPNAVIFARRPLAHYIFSLTDNVNMTVGLEDPDTFVDTTGDTGATKKFRAPDGGFNVRWEPGSLGHVQFSTIFRSIGVNGGTFKDQDVFGWGVNLAAAINITPNDTAIFWGVYGQGVGGMGNDTSFVNSDAAFDSHGDLHALDYGSALLAFSHNWNPRWRSTVTYGYANLENRGSQTGDAYDYTHYASANVVFKVLKRLSVGLETLYGYHKVKIGDTGDVVRVQIGMVYSLFD